MIQMLIESGGTKHMAVPLLLQFFIGLTIQGAFKTLSTLLVDIHPAAPSTAQATNNLVRCELAAGTLALLDVILRRLGAGWSFVLFAVLCFVGLVLLSVVRAKGLAWRQTKRKNGG